MLNVHERKIIADMDLLRKAEVLDKAGNKIKLRDLWAEAPAVFVFLRHFGCEACRKHATEVWKLKDHLQAKGAKIHFIGNGTPHFLNVFVEENNMSEASFYTDPSLASFKAAGFRKGFWIDPGEMHSRGEFLWLAINFQIKHGHEEGNVWQLGGVLVVGKDGNPIYQFTSQMMGHFPPIDDIKVK